MCETPGDFLNKELERISVSLKKNEGIINFQEYGIDKTGKINVAPALSAAIKDVMTTLSVMGVGGKTFQTLRLILPSGKFLIDSSILIDYLPGSTYLGDSINLDLEGATKTGTVLQLGPNATYMFDIRNGSVSFSKFRALGHSKGTFAKIGSLTEKQPKFEMLSQSVLREVEGLYFNKIFEINHWVDSSFYDCGFFSFKGTNPIGIEIKTHETDCTNNLQFYRCHWEHIVGGTYFKATGNNTSGARVHNNFGFFGCHFETRSFNSCIFDLKGVTRFTFTSTQFTQNNYPSGQEEGITENDLIPMFKLENINSMTFTGCTLGIQTTKSSLPNKMFELGGYVTGVSFMDSFISNGVESSNQSINDLYQSNKETPYISLGGDWANFNNTHFNNEHLPPIYNSELILGSPIAKNRKWGFRHMGDTNVLTASYTSDSSKVLNTEPLFEFSNDGMFKAKSFSSLTTTTLNHGQKYTFSIPFITNPNKRGIYLVYADDLSPAFAILYSSGETLSAAFIGSKAYVANSETSIDGKLNIYLNQKNIEVKNLMGISRRVSVIPFI